MVHELNTSTGSAKKKPPSFKGKKHTKEARLKISQAHKGRKHTEESRRNMSEARKGIPAWNKGKTIPKISGKYHWNWQGGPVTTTCLMCEKEFLANKRRVDKGFAKYCSQKCSAKSREGRPAWNKGKTGCFSNETLLRMSEAQKGKIRSFRGKKRPEFSDERHPAWKGGVAAEHNQIRRSEEYKEWRTVVYKRDYWTCQHCGVKCTADQIIAHHIKSFTEYVELRFDVDNGITLCRGCHNEVHFGGENNVVEITCNG